MFSAGEYDEASDVLNNLGYIIKPLMCCEEVSCSVSSLSVGQKYKLLTDHYKASIDVPFPRVFHWICNRSFQHKHGWKSICMVSLQALDGGFCKFCILFARHRIKLSVIVNKPFATRVKVHKATHNAWDILKIMCSLFDFCMFGFSFLENTKTAEK